MLYKLLCLEGFHDGTLIPRRVAPGEILEDVPEAFYKRLMQSDPSAWQVLETRVPDPTDSDGNPVLPGTVAERLAAAFDNPDAIAAASDEDLLEVKGVGPATLEVIRRLFPAPEQEDDG